MSYELRQYDPEGDDRRGKSHHEGFYRSREKAQAKANRYNAAEIERHNNKCKAYWAKRQRSFDAALVQYGDMCRLFDLGLSDKEPVPPVWHVTFNEWREYTEWTELPLPTSYYPEKYRDAEKPIVDTHKARIALSGGYQQPVPMISWDDDRLAFNIWQPDHYYVTEIEYDDDTL